MKMGIDGIAINAEGSRIYYCPLISRRLSIPIESLVDRDMEADTVAATVTGEVISAPSKVHNQLKSLRFTLDDLA